MHSLNKVYKIFYLRTQKDHLNFLANFTYNRLTMIICILAPVARCFVITSFKNIISVNFIVISSSFLKMNINLKK